MIVTRVLDQRLHSRGFNMSGPITCHNMPDKETSSGEGQRKEMYYAVEVHWEEVR
jgi:hypothetical protein